MREMTQADVADVAALQRSCFPAPFPFELLWTPEHLTNHLRLFPEGQFVAVEGSCIVGSASSLLITQSVWQAHGDWDQVTGGLDLSGHNAAGTVLYGADISVHPDFRGRGIARRLYRARFELVESLGLEMYGTVCRIPDFQDSPFDEVLDYADSVARGEAADRTLTPLLKMGLTYRGVVLNHMDDAESGHAAAILEWRP